MDFFFFFSLFFKKQNFTKKDENVMAPRCEFKNCNRTAFWREPGVINQPARWCREHRGPNDIYPYLKTCEFVSSSGHRCSRKPLYGMKGKDERPMRCSKHMNTLLDTNWYQPTCVEKGCGTVATYGFAGGVEAQWCSKHVPTVGNNNARKEGGGEGGEGDDIPSVVRFVDGKYLCHGKTKMNKPCQVVPSFQHPDYPGLRWCGTHKPEGSKYRVESKYCHHEGCEVVSSYGTYDEKKDIFTRKWCAQHAVIGEDTPMWIIATVRGERGKEGKERVGVEEEVEERKER